MRRTACFSLLGSLVLAGCAPSEEPAALSEVDQPIIGGFPETSRRYAISLRFEAQPGLMELRCSASLIGKRTVLTAGHCVDNQSLPSPTEVGFGPDVYNPDFTIPVASFVMHPGYDLNTVANDIAVIELASDAPEQAVNLIRETMPAGEVSRFTGSDVTYIGYGTTVPMQPMHGQRRVVAYPMTSVGPTNFQGFPVHASSWLWFEQNMAEATCSGDSGGPAMFVENGVERQIGVHSTSNCESAGTDARSDQWMLDDFLQFYIDTFENNDPCRSDGTCNADCQTGSTELVDPDCTENHCAADGVCARACVMPADPDCNWGQTLCQDGDGACNPACETLDAECAQMCGMDGVCVVACDTPDPDCGAGVGTTAGVGGGSSAGVGGGWVNGVDEPEDYDVTEGCGCRIGPSRHGGAAWLLLLGLLLARRRD